MNAAPDYAAAYVVLGTDDPGGLAGHGLTFTIGRGTEIVSAAVHALLPMVEGADAEALFADMGAFARRLSGDSQLRWIGPEKGAVHLATAAVLNATWDLFAKARGVPLWQLVAEMSPAELVSLVDWRYLSDALTPAAAYDLLAAQAPGRADRIEALKSEGLPAYTTSAGWMGYDLTELRRRSEVAVADGFGAIKVKVGAGRDVDVERLEVVRDVIGDRDLLLDANQVWDVPDAVSAMAELARFSPVWIEEPTCPDDILGHATIARAVAPIKVASGEMAHNRVMFKQFLQAKALGIVQLDPCRLASINEVLAVQLLAASAGIPVCPHAGGVGLCEYAQHLTAIDAIAVAGTTEGRLVEYVDALHEHFLDPAVVEGGAYRLPSAAGFSIEMRPSSLADHRFPQGLVWDGVLAEMEAR